MPLPVPEIPENRAAQYAANIILRANQAEENVGREYIATYQHTWGVSQLGGGSIHTQQQMQDIIDAMPPTTVALLLGMGRQFVSTYGTLLPVEYHKAAWAFEVGANNRVVIGELLPVWQSASTEAT